MQVELFEVGDEVGNLGLGSARRNASLIGRVSVPLPAVMPPMNREVSPRSFSPCEHPLAEGLPEHLRERVRLLVDRSPDRDAQAPSRDGELVIYWMHHAVRGHENPALDVARLLAEALGLPLLVYQGLAGRHRYNADRHHAFILEGARDAHAELEAQIGRASCRERVYTKV